MVNMRRGNIERGARHGATEPPQGRLARRSGVAVTVQTGTAAAKPIPDACRAPRPVGRHGAGLNADDGGTDARLGAGAHHRPTLPVTFTNTHDCIFAGSCVAIMTFGTGASINFTNTGDLAVLGVTASAIYNATASPLSPITINNSGDIATAGVRAHGIQAASGSRNSSVSIVSSGDIATIGFNAHGIYGYTGGRSSSLSITNSGGIATEATMPGASSATPLAQAAISRSPIAATSPPGPTPPASPANLRPTATSPSPIAARSPREGSSPMASTPTREAATPTSPSRTAAKSRQRARTPTASAPLPIVAAARSASSIAGTSRRQGFWPAASSARPMAQAARSKSTTAAALVARACSATA